MNTLRIARIAGFVLVMVFAAKASEATTADDAPNGMVASVTATNGLRLGVYVWPLSGFTNTTEEMIVLRFNMSNHSGQVFVPQNEYFARLSLSDESNRTVPKTALGSSYDLKTRQLIWGDDRFMGRQLPSTTGRGSHYSWDVGNGWSRGLELPPVSRLFQLGKPGEYRLRIEAQVLLKHVVAGKLVQEGISFPALEVPVVRPSEQNTPPK